VSTPKCVEALALDELPLGTNIISQKVHMIEDHSSAKISGVLFCGVHT
jgi:hypothetical protein